MFKLIMSNTAVEEMGNKYPLTTDQFIFIDNTKNYIKKKM